jgi:hypothetical protein
VTDAHAWFRSRVPAHLLEVLPDPESARFLEHARECAECAALLSQAEEHFPQPWAGTAHLPLTLLGRWLNAPESLSAPDRATIEAHLATCAECREDATSLAEASNGAEARARIAGIESRGKPSEHSEPPSRAARAPIPIPRSRTRDWFTGGFVGALATAASFAIVWPMLHRAPSPSLGPAPTHGTPTAGGTPSGAGGTPTPGEASTPGTTPTPEAHAPVLRSTSVTEFTSDLVRAPDGAPRKTVVDVKISSRDTDVYLKLEPPDAPENEAIRVKIEGPDGTPLADERLPRSDFNGDRMFVFSQAKGFHAGVYRITLSRTRDAGPKSVTYSLRIRV